MKKGFSVLAVLAFALGLYCLAPINNPPGGTGATGPAGPSGSPGPQGSPGPNTIAATTEILKGDNAGGAVAATQGTDYARSGYTTTVTNGTTTTLTVASQRNRFFTGSQDQIVKLPVTSTLYLGFDFLIVNNSSDTISVQSSGDSEVISLPGGTASLTICVLTTGTTAASWDAKQVSGFPTAAQVQALIDGKRGVLGTASFDPSAGSIASPAYAGIVSEVTYDGAGTYGVTFSGNQSNVDYGVSVVLPIGGNAGEPWFFRLPSKSIGGFQIEISRAASNGGGNLGVPVITESNERITITVTRFVP